MFSNVFSNKFTQHIKFIVDRPILLSFILFSSTLYFSTYLVQIKKLLDKARKNKNIFLYKNFYLIPILIFIVIKQDFRKKLNLIK